MAASKTKPTSLSVQAFIDTLPDETKRAEAKALVMLMQSATGEEPKMWGPSIIGFGTHHYAYDSGREGDTPMVGFSPRKAATVLDCQFRGRPARVRPGAGLISSSIRGSK